MTARVEVAAKSPWGPRYRNHLKNATLELLLTFIECFEAHTPLVLYFMGKPILGATP